MKKIVIMLATICVSWLFFSFTVVQGREAASDVQSKEELITSGINLVKSGNYSSAIELFDQVIKADSSNETALRYKGIAKEKLKIELASLTIDVISKKDQVVTLPLNQKPQMDPEIQKKIERIREVWREVWKRKVDQQRADL